MFKFRSNSGQKCSPEPEPEPEQKGCSGTGTGIPVDLCIIQLLYTRETFGNFKIKTKMSDFEERVLIGWLAQSIVLIGWC